MAPRAAVLLSLSLAAPLAAAAGAPACAAEEASLIQVRGAGAVAKPPVAYAPPAAWWPKFDEERCPLQETAQCDLHSEADHGCGVRSMRFNKVYDVYTGGDTACLNTSQPYYFSVSRGSLHKLLLVFDDGGICLSQQMYETPGDVVCRKNPLLSPWSGLLNQSDVRNPYRHYSVVRVRMCSGDAHTGNNTQDWGPSGAAVPLKGGVNTAAVLDWAVAQFPSLTHLVVLGYSAGSVGAQAWADSIITRFGERESLHVAVHADSQAMVILPPAAATGFYQFVSGLWGQCDAPYWNAEGLAACRAGTVTGPGWFRSAIRNHPSVAFTMVNSKVDRNQLANAITPYAVNPTIEEWYKQATLIIKEHAELPNFRSYLVNEEFHVFTRKDEVFTTTPQGLAGGGDGTKLADWLFAFSECPHKSGGTPTHACQGPLLEVTEATPAPEPTYCDPALAGTGAVQAAGDVPESKA